MRPGQRSLAPGAFVASSRATRVAPAKAGGREESHCLLQAVMDAGIGEFRDLQQRNPSRGLAQGKPAWAARQREPQKIRAAADFPVALDCFGLPRERIEVEADRKPLQQIGELLRRDRCRVLHLSLESSRVASGQALF